MERLSISNERAVFVDTLKGIAIILVVIGHFSPKDINYDFWNIIHDMIYSFHMPLFMMVSGFLYEKTTALHSWSDYLRFLGKKWRRLLAPYFAISIVVIVVKLIAQKYMVMENPVTEDVFRYLLINPQGGYATFLWYVYTLFVIFLVFPLLRLILKSSVLIFLAMFAIYFIPFPEAFCLNLVGKYLLYFWCGVWSFKNIKVLLGNENRRYFYFILWFFLYIVVFLLSSSSGTGRSTLLSLIVAISGSMTVLLLAVSLGKKKIGNILSVVGLYSTAIYLFHTSGMAPVKMSLHSFLICGPAEFIVSAMLISFSGVVIPVILQIHLFDKSRSLSLLFLGVEPLRKDVR